MEYYYTPILLTTDLHVPYSCPSTDRRLLSTICMLIINYYRKMKAIHIDLLDNLINMTELCQ